MPRGGARVNSGPPPDPNALRRDRRQDKDGWTNLPAEGRVGDPPPWPLAALEVDPENDAAAAWSMERAERELDVWRTLWATPQAVVWARLGWTLEVAMYVRLVVKAERTAETKALAEARMWSDRLGLNPAAMLRNRWRIAADEIAVKREQRAETGRGSVRDRLRAVNGGA